MNKPPEIMAPAGSYEALHAAIKAGADSVYFGVGNLNMRSRAANFEESDLPEVARICREDGVRSYLTLNTIVYDEDLERIRSLCGQAREAGISAVIAMDIATIQAARSAGVAVHLSTQVNVTNIEAVRFYSTMADVVVLARELKLEQIREICRQIEEEDIRGPGGELVQIEIFVHGALCIGISGKCGMSLATYGSSANRGACLQNCRRSYRVTDDQTGEELVVDNEFVMSPSDLCTLPYLDVILKSGVAVLKIEGRGRGADYVYTVTRAYKEAAQAVVEDTFTSDKADVWMDRVSGVYNRGFWKGGYYLGVPINEWSEVYGSKATRRKMMVGVVKNYYKQAGVVEVETRDSGFSAGEDLLVTGMTTGIVELSPESLRLDDKEVDEVGKGFLVTFPCSERVRTNDKVFVVRER